MKSFFGLIALSAVMLTGWCDASAANFTVGGIKYTSITDPSGSQTVPVRLPGRPRVFRVMS